MFRVAQIRPPVGAYSRSSPQRPILLKGHERAITCVMYNNDGDLVLTAAKDQMPTLWYAKTGERIGTYQGHQGAVWDLSVSCEGSLSVWSWFLFA